MTSSPHMMAVSAYARWYLCSSEDFRGAAMPRSSMAPYKSRAVLLSPMSVWCAAHASTWSTSKAIVATASMSRVAVCDRKQRKRQQTANKPVIKALVRGLPEQRATRA
jgi:hypothetical protein